MKKLSITFIALALAGFVQAQIAPIDGTNTVGFIPVTVSADVTNTIITVPFEACLGTGSGMLADLVSTTGLTQSDTAGSADQLVVLTTNGADQVYYYYYNQTGVGWTAINTKKVVDGVVVGDITPPVASDFAVARGLGFWLKRVATGTETSIYLKGQVATTPQATLVGTNLNLIGCSSLAAFKLADVSWTGASAGANGNPKKMDKIHVNNGDGTLSEYLYYVGTNASLSNQWVVSTSNGPVLAGDVTIPAGKGFWFERRAPGTFTFQPGN